jgi:hypothetical protein
MTVKQFDEVIDDNLRRRSDLGIWKAIADLVLESANPFEPQAARQPKRWFVLVTLLLLLAGGCFLYFNYGP